ncbi:hypothetical protein EDB84DRAFT_1434262 [Lactarius hengduanensis]|nr:hypothetical protein EDB84DRAFT_1434262 [Lactarius hengduanensis]
MRPIETRHQRISAELSQRAQEAQEAGVDCESIRVGIQGLGCRGESLMDRIGVNGGITGYMGEESLKSSIRRRLENSDKTFTKYRNDPLPAESGKEQLLHSTKSEKRALLYRDIQSTNALGCSYVPAGEGPQSQVKAKRGRAEGRTERETDGERGSSSGWGWDGMAGWHGDGMAWHAARSTEDEKEVAVYPGNLGKMARSAGTTNRSNCQIALPFFFRARRRRQAVQVGLKFGWRRMRV